MSRSLTWEVFTAPAVPVAAGDPAPGQSERIWSPISATLVAGERDAVLVDPLMTVEQGHAVADWVAATGKNLSTVYVTHGHGDHWFGLSVIRERFPGVRAVATPAVVAYMHKQASPDTIARSWESRLPGQIPSPVAVAEPLPGPSFELEGHELRAVEVGHSDTDSTTVLHVPDLDLVVAGDVAYNDVHLHLGESDPQGRRDWIAALDTIDQLAPAAVVAGHKRPGREDDPRIVEETREYIREFDRLAGSDATAEQLYDHMLERYPDRINPGILWASARAVKH